ncbi:MAG: hypothetical protein ACYTFW_15610 [Planctomycetota bacterium]|jgi:predicted membrane protein
MKAFLTLVGLLVMLFVWFNPLGLDMLLRVALFILGFDMMWVVLKIVIFGINFVFPIFGEGVEMFSWTLLLLTAGEIVLIAFEADRPFRFIVKPFVVFAAVFISLGIQPAVALAGIDLLINMTTKIKRDGKKKSKHKTKKTKDEKGKPKNKEKRK